MWWMCSLCRNAAVGGNPRSFSFLSAGKSQTFSQSFRLYGFCLHSKSPAERAFFKNLSFFAEKSELKLAPFIHSFICTSLIVVHPWVEREEQKIIRRWKLLAQLSKAPPCVCASARHCGALHAESFSFGFPSFVKQSQPSFEFPLETVCELDLALFSSSRVLALGKPESRFRLHGSSNTRAITLTGTTGWKWDLILKRLSGTITGKSWPHFRAFDFLSSLLLES